MKAKEYQTKSVDELKASLAELKREQFNLRFQAATGEMQNRNRFRDIRRNVARILTVLNAKKKD